MADSEAIHIYKGDCIQSSMPHCETKETIIEFIQAPDSAVDDDNDDNTTTTSSSSSQESFITFHQKLHKNIGDFIEENKFILRCLLIGLVTIATVVYVIMAIVTSLQKNCQDIIPLIGLTCIVVVSILVWLLRKKCGNPLGKCAQSFGAAVSPKVRGVIKIMITIVAVIGIISVTTYTGIKQPGNLVALAGFITMIVILWLFSKYPAQVKWQPVLSGFCVQFYLALLILRWDFGYQVMHWMGQRVQTFLSYADYGAEFVFGPKYTDHIFAMKVLPVVIFFSCAINVLYYIGAMQMVINKMGWVLRKLLGTTAPESVCAAANIFIGLSEAPIMIRPFLSMMTRSELVTIMTGGFGSIAGGVMAAYISFGVPAEHLFCASVMNAPCALAVSKLLYPETEPSKVRKVSEVKMSDKKERNILEAAAAGASSSIVLVANIAANLIAFLAMLAFINALLSWFGSFLCYPELSFQLICSYLFMPIAYLMGVPWSDAGVVGELIGIKTFMNEFVAYKELAKFIDNRAACVGEIITVRSEIIATYALCGFANPGSIGIQLGALGPMAPERRGDFASVVLRAFIGGIVTCLMTASIAGLLLIDESADLCNFGGNMTSNMTLTQNVTLTPLTNVTYALNNNATAFL
ncbi:hypothetical protein ACF0H5_018983 [Mactra antiquata]